MVLAFEALVSVPGASALRAAVTPHTATIKYFQSFVPYSWGRPRSSLRGLCPMVCTEALSSPAKHWDPRDEVPARAQRESGEVLTSRAAKCNAAVLAHPS